MLERLAAFSIQRWTTACGVLLCCAQGATAASQTSASQPKAPLPDDVITVDDEAQHGVEEQDNEEIAFTISAGDLAAALTQFSQQAGLQIAFDRKQVGVFSIPKLTGRFTAAAMMDRLLSKTPLTWGYLGSKTIFVRVARAPPVAQPSIDDNTDVPSDQTTGLSDIVVIEDAMPHAAYQYSSASFGFDKPLLETPRTVSIVTDTAIDLFDLSAVEDLVRVVPGAFTTTRFGIQGSVDIRNVPADTYFRGMKRLTLQGHGRSVLAAMDTIEVVGGPASPLYGMGKIGGYTNMVPKSGRAKSGGYLTDTQAFFQTSFGDYNRAEISFGVGGPLQSLKRYDKQGGYYLYGLVEDSESFADGVPIKQRILQAAVSIDNFVGRWRLEAGASYQYSATAGALTGRFTQALVDSGQYIRGVPLVDLDLNGNGTIGYLEMQSASPVLGSLSIGNQPLMQTWVWPRDAAGNPYPLGQFPVVTGIPQSLYDYLVAHPEADPTGALRAQGVGGPLPQSGYVPVGMVLDPRTTGYSQLDLRRAAAFERELKANFLTLFADLIFDSNPDLTFKNQLFFDGMDQYKASNQPYSTTQTVIVVEEKFTMTHRWQGAPNWLRLNSLASVNYRTTISRGRSLFGDFSTHRTDAMASTWLSSTAGMTPNTTFANGYDNPDLYADGYPWGGDYRTQFSEFGLGALFDIDIGKTSNLLLGARIDASEASNVDYAGLFNATTGTSANPGRYATQDSRAHRWDRGASWNVSWSQQLPGNIRPYATYAQASIVLDGNNNALTNAVINAGHVGSAVLREVGLKHSSWSDRIFVALAAYEQRRADVDATDDPALLNAYATATNTRGVELQFKLTPTSHWALSLYGLKQHTYYEPNIGANLLVDARTLGFQDVLDAQGRVIYPAEAFLYGGRSRLALPGGLPQYEEKQGNPPLQIGFNTLYRMTPSLGVTLSGNYFSSTCSGRLCWVRLPASHVYNAGLVWGKGHWQCKLQVLNVTDERYFRARTGDTLGDVLAQAMPGRHWQAAIKRSF